MMDLIASLFHSSVVGDMRLACSTSLEFSGGGPIGLRC